MFTRPPLAPVLIGIWLVPLLIGMLVDPFSAWSMYLPKPAAAAFRLREVQYFNRSLYCSSGSQSDWRVIAESAHPETWFRALVVEGVSPAARLYGMVGLYQVDYPEFERLLSTHPLFTASDSLPLITETKYSKSSPLYFLRKPVLDTIITLFSHALPRPICD